MVHPFRAHIVISFARRRFRPSEPGKVSTFHGLSCIEALANHADTRSCFPESARGTLPKHHSQQYLFFDLSIIYQEIEQYQRTVTEHVSQNVLAVSFDGIINGYYTKVII
jgi:hypothetical protein